MSGTVIGPPSRRRLKPDDDPFGAVGDYAGSFLVKSALEISGGYDTNPGRFVTEKGSPVYVIAPELLVVSDWSRSPELMAGCRRVGKGGRKRC